jgi:hypothetical protein
LDALERDYQQVYHDDTPPFEEGFEESIRKWKENDESDFLSFSWRIKK